MKIADGPFCRAVNLQQFLRKGEKVAKTTLIRTRSERIVDRLGVRTTRKDTKFSKNRNMKRRKPEIILVEKMT